MKWKWAIGVGIVLLAFWFFWASKSPKHPKLFEIRWRANASIADLIPCDLDADGRDEVIVKTLKGQHWWLRPHLQGWGKALMPVREVVATCYNAPLHFGVLVRANNALCFLFHRNGWRLRKLLDAPVDKIEWLDIDRDGKVNDVLVLKSQILWWFKIGDDGEIAVQDKIRVPPKTLPSEFTLLSQRGKLLVTRKYVPWLTEEVPDWDGDGVTEIAFFEPSGFEEDKIAVPFSKTKTLKQFILPRLRSLPVHPCIITIADLEGEGRRELIAFASDLQRIIVVNQEGRWHLTPCSVVYPFVKLQVTRVGERDWVWVMEPERLWLLRRKGEGYQVRQWKLGSEDYPLAVWRDKQGIWCAIISRTPLDSYAFGGWITKVANWFLSLGIPINAPKEKVRLNFWKWDERSDDWKQVKQISFLSLRAVNSATLLDMNGDGQNELLASYGRPVGVDVFVGIPEEMWLFAGQLHFVGEYRYYQAPVILRDGQRRWIVFADGKKPKILRALTLTRTSLTD